MEQDEACIPHYEALCMEGGEAIVPHANFVQCKILHNTLRLATRPQETSTWGIPGIDMGVNGTWGAFLVHTCGS